MPLNRQYNMKVEAVVVDAFDDHDVGGGRLTPPGAALEARLSEAQRARVRRAYREAGPEAVAGFRRVLERMIEPSAREDVLGLVGTRR